MIWRWLEDHGACDEAVEWAKARPDASLEELWARCPIGSWMLWLLGYMCEHPGWPGLRHIAGTLSDLLEEMSTEKLHDMTLRNMTMTELSYGNTIQEKLLRWDKEEFETALAKTRREIDEDDLPDLDWPRRRWMILDCIDDWSEGASDQRLIPAQGWAVQRDHNPDSDGVDSALSVLLTLLPGSNYDPEDRAMQLSEAFPWDLGMERLAGRLLMIYSPGPLKDDTDMPESGVLLW